MTVLFVLATFAIFLTIDFFYSKAKHPVLQVAPAISKVEGAVAARPRPSLVGGFSVPDNLRYPHPGHTWALSESPNLVRRRHRRFRQQAQRQRGTGESAAAGPVDPPRPEGVEHRAQRREGRHGFAHRRQRGRREQRSSDPSLVSKDPYGEGRWFPCRHPTPRPASAICSAAHWRGGRQEESSMRLQRMMPSALGALAQGGVAVNDLAATLSRRAVGESDSQVFLNIVPTPRGASCRGAVQQSGATHRPCSFEMQGKATSAFELAAELLCGFLRLAFLS